MEPIFLISLKSASCVLELIKNSNHVTLCHQSRHQTPKALGSSLLCSGWLDIILKLSESLASILFAQTGRKKFFVRVSAQSNAILFKQQYKILKMLSGLDFPTTSASFLFSIQQNYESRTQNSLSFLKEL